MKLKYIWITTGLLACITGCDDKLETYETSGEQMLPLLLQVHLLILKHYQGR